MPNLTETSGRPNNPFKGYQNRIVAKREQIIIRYLASLRKTRASFEYVTDLAKAVAAQVEMAESKPCSFTTLLRNKRYKALLLNYIAMRSGTGAIHVSEPAAQALVQAAQLELGNVNRDNERLRVYIAELETRLTDKPALQSSPAQRLDSASELSRLSNEKALACKALWLVLDHFKDLVCIDADRRCIIDLSASRRKNVVVGPDIAEPFFQWVRDNSGTGI